jgi:dTDP-4-dehydrorhamnose 3,5-epimerase
MGFIVDVVLTPLKIIKGDHGDVLHVIKSTDETFTNFGEAYFSTVSFQSIKGWKKHHKMILNLVVPVGAIKFVMYDDRKNSETFQQFQEITLSKDNYQRLTIPPGIWVAFAGVANADNILLNVASIPHQPLEAESLPLVNELIQYTFNL